MLKAACPIARKDLRLVLSRGAGLVQALLLGLLLAALGTLCILRATLAAEGKAYHIPRHSDAMDPAAYRQGLALWLSKCPMEPETPAALER